MRRVFVDANVLIAGADSRTGASHAVLLMAEVGLFRAIVCKQVLDEAEKNLRKKLPRALSNFAAQMARLRLEILPDPSPEEARPYEAIIDASDAVILKAAVLASADRLITLNTRDFTQDVAKQCGIDIQTPAQFVEEIRQMISDG